jgi:ornithine cyclodeaminase
MVKYIGTSDLQAHLARHCLPEVIGGMVQYLREDFLRWPQFDKSARVASHSARGVIELMPISDGRWYAFKYVNGHPANTAQGLLTVTAFGVLAEVASGYPRLLSELTLTTALRTAATSVLAAQHGAPEQPQHGAHRQWCAGGLPGHCFPYPAGHHGVAAL